MHSSVNNIASSKQTSYNNTTMGTEILPQFLKLLNIIIGAVGVATIFVIIISKMHYYTHANKREKEKQAESKDHIITGLIAIIILVIVYLLLSGIGPAFKLLFYS